MTNWKTTVVGLAILLGAVANIWVPRQYQGKVNATVSAIAGAGFLVTKDHDK